MENKIKITNRVTPTHLTRHLHLKWILSLRYSSLLKSIHHGQQQSKGISKSHSASYESAIHWTLSISNLYVTNHWISCHADFSKSCYQKIQFLPQRCIPSVSRGKLGENRSEILVFPSPTGYKLTSFEGKVPLLLWDVYLWINSSTMMSNFPGVFNLNR